jgi:hypothetical protein
VDVSTRVIAAVDVATSQARVAVEADHVTVGGEAPFEPWTLPTWTGRGPWTLPIWLPTWIGCGPWTLPT